MRDSESLDQIQTAMDKKVNLKAISQKKFELLKQEKEEAIALSV